MAKTEERICIIGGGPAGISAAMYLEKKGYQNYVIYEKLNRVGGKCFSPRIKIKHNGVEEERSFEVGSVMSAINYHCVLEMEEFGGYHHCGPDFKENEPKLIAECRKPNGEIYSPFEIKDMMPLVQKLFGLLQTKYIGYDCYGHLGIAKGEYSGLSKGIEGKFGATKENSFPNYIKGKNPNLKDLALPFSEFCKLNGVEEVQKVWLIPFVSYGYGFFDEIPAAYVMKYLDATCISQYINCELRTYPEGTQQIYEHVNKKLKHPALLETEVVKVERPEGKVLVTIKGKDGKQKTEEFDKLIITTPLDYFANYADASKEEKELFSKITHKRYCDYIGTFDEGKSPKISAYIPDNMVPEKLGHAMVYYSRWQNIDGDCPATVYSLANHAGSKDIDFDVAMKTMDEDMKQFGFPIKEKFYKHEFYYMPHVSPQDYSEGWYDRLEELQGKRNTFYGGEILSFGDMEDTCAVSKDIIERFF